MASEEDNFDIDIYGDGEGDLEAEPVHMDYKVEDEEEEQHQDQEQDQEQAQVQVQENGGEEGEPIAAEETTIKTEPDEDTQAYPQDFSQEQETPQHEQPSNNHAGPTQPAPSHGTKRKETSDDRPVDPGATNALMISDLHWWITEDDIRGWAHDAEAEDELKELSFSEHKVNGKSKGQAYLEFSSPQAATATKHQIENAGGNQPGSRKHSVVYTAATQNPFKTLPKEPSRAREERPPVRGSFHSAPRADHGYGAPNHGYRGGRGGGFNRGGYNAHNQYNRNFASPMGGFNNNNTNNMAFQGNMGMANNYVPFNRGGMMGNPMRGNMGGMRGNRGGMNSMMPMGGMGMGNMAMNPMMAGMGMTGWFESTTLEVLID
ncbi:hypothetical protein A1O1_05978 [Capronia coronata CBS 617.96]|uniref:RRM domain-containing protein n=1 Tax=Capronia coronata CBS 617.96 TaxID=1182541 RepID=W9XYJ1_9EURO|nr:uncharacterized protein A1O1_05978 [Capronia coronata CBS 617.96]EXJ85612.1 hypothetical protein A1O1_05978 [Capronia coronata CBS 617.96]